MTAPSEVGIDTILPSVFVVRGVKAMLDSDLAVLYGVSTKRLNERVKRNLTRFPDDFMFQLSQDDFKILKSHSATSSWGGRRTLPYAFTEPLPSIEESVGRLSDKVAEHLKAMGLSV